MKQNFGTLAKWLGRVVLGLAVLYVLLLAISGVMLHRAYKAIEHAGRPTHPDDLLAPEIPDYDNAAVLIECAALRLKARRVDFEYIKDFALPESSPDRKATGVATLFYHLNWLNAAQSVDNEFGEQFRARHREVLMTEPLVAEALQILKEACARPTLQFDVDALESSLVSKRTLSQLNDLLRLARILSSRAEIRAAEGDLTGAWDDLITGLRMADLLAQERGNVPLMVRVAILSSQIAQIGTLAEVGLPTDGQYPEIDVLLQSAEDFDLLRAVDMDRFQAEQGIFLHPTFDLELLDSEPKPWHRLAAKYWVRPLRQADHAAYLRNVLTYCEYVQQPFAPEDAVTQAEDIYALPVYAPGTQAISPNVKRKFEVYITRARARVARTALAVLRHHRDTGAFPEQPPLPREEWVDPFTGDPLIYRRIDDDFLLYSVGPDLKDDKGTPTVRGCNLVGDLVWPDFWRSE